jgi:hypothetical protein
MCVDKKRNDSGLVEFEISVLIQLKRLNRLYASLKFVCKLEMYFCYNTFFPWFSFRISLNPFQEGNTHIL